MNTDPETRPLVWDTAAVLSGALRCVAAELDLDLVHPDAAVAMLTRCWDGGAPELLAVDLALMTGADEPWQAVPSAALQEAWSRLVAAQQLQEEEERAIA